MMRFKLALRNITRHRLRSLLSISMIAGAVAAVILFQGFSSYSLSKETRTERLFHLSELNQLQSDFPEIERLSGRLSFFGLISNGDLSVGGKIIGINPVGEPHFKKSMKITIGTFFGDLGVKEVVVGALLAKQMNVKPGDNITILTNTIDGIMNAMDLTVAGIFSAGIDEIDAQVIYMPLAITQEILDTQKVEIAVLKFKALEMAEANLNAINVKLSKTRPTLFARSWRQLASLFRQVDKFYSVQNRLIEGILLALMFLGILNTVSMTVVERTGEIGTLRALGESRKEIVLQFILESTLLSFIGITIGILVAAGCIHIVDTIKIMTEMPGASTPFQIKIFFMMSSIIYASCLATVTTVIATMIPALRASRMDIVEALRKNV
jgi:putative ABC transport system permease protein